ncbi:MAG: FlgO family outer membrane protein [Spirochaetota bacterium]
MNYSAFKISILLLWLCASCSSGKKKINTVAYINPTPRTPMRIIADSLSQKIGKKKLKLMVLTFTDMRGNEHNFGDVLSEKLSTELAKKDNVVILDRLLFQKKLAQNDLSLQGGIDLESMRAIGNFLELDAVVTGLVSPYANGLDINCRLIDTRSGKILAAEETYYSLKFN